MNVPSADNILEDLAPNKSGQAYIKAWKDFAAFIVSTKTVVMDGGKVVNEGNIEAILEE